MRPWWQGPGCPRDVPAENREKWVGKGLEKGWETLGKHLGKEERLGKRRKGGKGGKRVGKQGKKGRKRVGKGEKRIGKWLRKRGKAWERGKKGWARDGKGEKNWKTVGKRGERVGKGGKGLERGWKMEKRVGKGGSAPIPALERTQRLWWDGFSSSSGRELGMALGELSQELQLPLPGKGGREVPGSMPGSMEHPPGKRRAPGGHREGQGRSLGMVPRDDPGEMARERLGSSLLEFFSWSGNPETPEIQEKNPPKNRRSVSKNWKKNPQKPEEKSTKTRRRILPKNRRKIHKNWEKNL